jgi:glycosyltransferase involved in cell wall biosynthesis
MSSTRNSSMVSVVIPTCNRSELVYRAVTSALSQTYSDTEVIVVVDGPDQATTGKLRQIDDTRLKIVQILEKVGGSEARNVGVRESCGEWIAFLDDDDEWFPEKLEKQIAAANRIGSRSLIVASRFIARSPHCDYLWPRRLPGPFEPLSEYLFVRKSVFFGEGLLQTSTLFTSKELLLKFPFATGLKKHQDWDWVLRVARCDGVTIEILPEPLAVWHIEGDRNSVSTESTWRFSLDWIRNNRNLVTKRAYAAFIVTQVGPQAARQSEWKAFWPLFREMFRGGSPRIVDVLTFPTMWLVSQKYRRGIRALCTRIRGTQTISP